MASNAGKIGENAMEICRIRDITRIRIAPEDYLVIACDSSGGIGSKIHDQIKVSEEFLGRFSLRVPLMEVLATGAEVITIINTLSVEMHPCGERIIRGIAKEAQEAGIEPAAIINGSTEDNIPVSQTALGITVIGLAKAADFRPGQTQSGDIIVCIGQPYYGHEVGERGEDFPGFATPGLVQALLKIQGVHELLPVGSKGILHELTELCRTSNQEYSLLGEHGLDLEKSAGPATCLLASMRESCYHQLNEKLTQQMAAIARIL